MEQSHTRKISFTFPRHKKINLIFLVILSFFLFGCGLVPSNQAQTATPSKIAMATNSFLSMVPCSAPCFFDSTPGVTRKNEVFDHLKKYDLFSFCREKQIDNSESSMLNCDPSIGFWFKGNMLTEIIIEPTIPITLEQVIEKYGEPTDVNYSLGGTNDVTLVKLVYYENYQFVLHLSDPTSPQKQDNNINPESKILWVNYVDKETLKTYIDKCTLSWNGYRDYEMKPGC